MSQGSYQVRFDWGHAGAAAVGADAEAVVWVSQLAQTPGPAGAVGGTLERAAGCFDAGADSIATIGDVTGHADPLARAAAWLTATAAHP